MRTLLATCVAFAILPCSAIAKKLDIVGPAGSSAFGARVGVLKNGNIVVADLAWPDGKNWGAVYLYAPDGKLISALAGHATSRVGYPQPFYLLDNGNFVVPSSTTGLGCPQSGQRGEFTWVDGEVGFNGPVTSRSSLTCMGYDVSYAQLIRLANGHYVVVSGGYVTRVDGFTGEPRGPATQDNSFVGAYDVVALANGNYVILDDNWGDYRGAVTFASGTLGIKGIATAANSLLGSQKGDEVGSGGIVELPNGDFVVSSPKWRNAGQAEAGAATWIDGTKGIVGAVSSTNSLVGTSSYDRVGSVIKPLANGNYVVAAPYWTDWTSGAPGVGSVTWGSKSGGVSGIVSPGNSLKGINGLSGSKKFNVVPLMNGNFVLETYSDSVSEKYVAHWVDGSAMTTGQVSAANSLVASSRYGSVTPLANGNYVFADPDWVNPDWVDPATNQVQARKVGAVMWVDGGVAQSGAVVPADALLGNGFGLAGAVENYGYSGVMALTDGNYVVCSSYFSADGAAGTPKSIGAVTWGDGTNGTTGVISKLNSLTGASAGDTLCRGTTTSQRGIIALPGGHYLVRSPYWNGAGAAQAGAVTWVEGGGLRTGEVAPTNSFVGTLPNEHIGGALDSIIPLSDGHYVLSNPAWSNGGLLPGLGSVTLGEGASGNVGELSPQNSLVGAQINDTLGSGKIVPFANGWFVVNSPYWHDTMGRAVGAITLGSSVQPLAGPLEASSSVVGGVENAGPSMTYAFDETNERLVVGQPASNKVTVLTLGVSELFADGFE